jgi:hypothetical protein
MASSTLLFLLLFLNGLISTDNCYQCKFASVQRVSDITLGDAWGTHEPKTEMSKGISLLLCQTSKGISLVKDLAINSSDINFLDVLKNNRQLNQPSLSPKNRESFFEDVKKSGKFNSCVRNALPISCFKQYVKKILVFLHILNK